MVDISKVAIGDRVKVTELIGDDDAIEQYKDGNWDYVKKED